jgi:hypothetical protein
MFADGYAQAGLFGILFATVVAAVVFRVLDRLAVDRDPKLVLPTCLPLASCLADGNIFGLILTNGLWMLLLMVFLLPKHGTETKKAIGLATS